MNLNLNSSSKSLEVECSLLLKGDVYEAIGGRSFLSCQRRRTDGIHAKNAWRRKGFWRAGEESTIQDATKRVGLSRSAFYKYRDTVFPFESIARERILTIFIQLEDRKGSLATLLHIISEAKCNVLTIHQTIPVQARANITLSLDVTEMEIKMEEFLQRLKVPDFVDAVNLISSGAL